MSCNTGCENSEHNEVIFDWLVEMGKALRAASPASDNPNDVVNMTDSELEKGIHDVVYHPLKGQ